MHVNGTKLPAIMAPNSCGYRVNSLLYSLKNDSRTNITFENLQNTAG